MKENVYSGIHISKSKLRTNNKHHVLQANKSVSYYSEFTVLSGCQIESKLQPNWLNALKSNVLHAQLNEFCIKCKVCIRLRLPRTNTRNTNKATIGRVLVISKIII